MIAAQVKEVAQNSRDTPAVILADALETASQIAIARLPQLHHMKRTVNYASTAKCNEPPLPMHGKDIDFGTDTLPTSKGDNFFLYDSGFGDEEQMFIFGTQRNLQILSTCNKWFVGGTFNVVPLLFYQLFTFHGLQYGHTFPLLYALLPAKKERTYLQLLCQLKALKLHIGPEIVMQDFELTAINAFSGEFPSTRQQRCFVHFRQAIQRQIHANGLKSLYKINVHFALETKLLVALAFVHVTKEEGAFEDLVCSDCLPPALEKVTDYFEDNWLGRALKRGCRQAPRFPLQMWNCYKAAVAERSKVNNTVEGWHRAFDSTLQTSHGNICKLIEALKKEQVLTEVKYEQASAGKRPTK